MCAHRLETYNYIRTRWKSGPHYVSDAPRSVISIIEKALTALPVSENGEVLRTGFDEEHALAILSVQLTPSPGAEERTEDSDNVFIHAVVTNEVAHDDLRPEDVRALFESVYGAPLAETISARQEEFSEVDFPRDRECARPCFIRAEQIREIFPTPASREKALPLSALLRSQGPFADPTTSPPKEQSTPLSSTGRRSAERNMPPLDLPFEPSPDERHTEPMEPTNPQRHVPTPASTGLILGSLALGSLLGALFIITMLLVPTESGFSLRNSLGLVRTASLPDPVAAEEQRVAYEKLIDSYESQLRIYRAQSRTDEIASEEPTTEILPPVSANADHAAPVTTPRSTPDPAVSPAIITHEPSATPLPQVPSETAPAEHPPGEEVLLPFLNPPGLFDIVIHNSSFLRMVPAVDGNGPLRVLQDGERYTVTGVISQDDGRWFELRYGWIEKSSHMIKSPLATPTPPPLLDPPEMEGTASGTSLPPEQLAYPGLFNIRIERGINLYPAPTTAGADPLHRLRTGEEYTVISEQVTPAGIWYEVRYGWVKQTSRTHRVDLREPQAVDAATQDEFDTGLNKDARSETPTPLLPSIQANPPHGSNLLEDDVDELERGTRRAPPAPESPPSQTSH